MTGRKSLVFLCAASVALLGVKSFAGDWSSNSATPNVVASTGGASLKAAADDGNYGVILVWTDDSSGDDEVWLQRLDPIARPRWGKSNLQLTDASQGDTNEPAIAGDGFGGSYVAWSDHRFVGDYVTKNGGTEEYVVHNGASPGPFSGTLVDIPVEPGSLTLTMARDGGGTLTADDNGSGSLVGIHVNSGTINYATGAVTITWNYDAKPDAWLIADYRGDSEQVTRNGVSAGPGPFAGILAETPVQAGSLVLTMNRDGGGTLTATDNGGGILTGADVITGTVAYATGSVSVTWSANAAANAWLVADYKGDDEQVAQNVASAGPGPFGGTLSYTPIEPGTVTLTMKRDGGGKLTAADDGAGNLTGVNVSTGTVDYVTGAVSITWAADAASDAWLVAEYGTTSGVGPFTGLLNRTPVLAGTLVLKMARDGGGTLTANDPDGDGNLNGADVASGTVNYSTGQVTVTWNAAAAAGAWLTATYDILEAHGGQVLARNSAITTVLDTNSPIVGEDAFTVPVPDQPGPFSFSLSEFPVEPNSLILVGTDSGGANITSMDDGSGQLTGSASGTINYLTGAITVTWSTDLLAGTSIFATYAAARYGPFSGTASVTPLIPGYVTVQMAAWDGSTLSAVDDGAGVLTGADVSAGTVTYATGAITVTWNRPADFNAPLNASYYLQSAGPWGGVLSRVPVTPGSVTLTMQSTTGAWMTATDNGVGVFVGDVVAGTINYGTGLVSVTWNTAAGADARLEASYNSPAPGFSQVSLTRLDKNGMPAEGWPDANDPAVTITPQDSRCAAPALFLAGGGVYLAYKDFTRPWGPDLLPTLMLSRYTPGGALEWETDVGPIGTASAIEFFTDGDTGVIISWRTGTFKLDDASWETMSSYAARVDRDGYSVWGPRELYRTLKLAYVSSDRAVCPDGSGGMFVAGGFSWNICLEKQPGIPEGALIEVNHLMADGTWEWAEWDWGTVIYSGTPQACEWDGATQSLPAVVSDGRGGVLVALACDRFAPSWNFRSPNWTHEPTQPFASAHPDFTNVEWEALYGQHIDPDGKQRWNELALKRILAPKWDEGVCNWFYPDYPKTGITYGWLEGLILSGPNRYFFEPPKIVVAANSAMVTIWRDFTTGVMQLYVSESLPNVDAAEYGYNGYAHWMAAVTSVPGGLDPNEDFFVVPNERFGAYVAFSSGGTVYASHVNYWLDHFWSRVEGHIGPGPDIFPPAGPVADFNAEGDTAEGGIVVEWTNPARVVGGELLGTATVGADSFTTTYPLIHAGSYTVYEMIVGGFSTELARNAPYGADKLYVDAISDVTPEVAVGDWVRVTGDVSGAPTKYFRIVNVDAARDVLTIETPVWQEDSWNDLGFEVDDDVELVTSAVLLEENVNYTITLNHSPGLVIETGAGFTAGTQIVLAYDSDYYGDTILDNFWGVEIRRSSSAPPSTPADGKWVYGGPNNPTQRELTYVDTEVQAMTTYYYAAFTFDSIYMTPVNYYGYGPSDNASYDLGDVTNLTAVPGNGQITISWTNPSFSAFDHVQLFRSAIDYPSDPEAPDGLLPANSTAESFTDVGLTNGIRYYYTVFVYDFNGIPSRGATIDSVALPTLGFITTPADAYMTIDWMNPTGDWFHGVEFYRATPMWGGETSPSRNTARTITTEYTRIYPTDPVEEGGGTAETWTDSGLTTGTTYDYFAFIVATDELGYLYSDAFHQTATTLGPTQHVTDFVATPSDGKIDLTWANPVLAAFDHVQVFRSETGFPDNPTAADGLLPGGSTLETHEDTDVQNGTRYYYTAYAYYSAGNDQPSPPNNIQAMPLPVLKLNATGGLRCVILSWPAPTAGWFQGVELYRWIGGTNRYAATRADATNPANFVNITAAGSPVTDADRPGGFTYYYTLFVVGNDLPGVNQDEYSGPSKAKAYVEIPGFPMTTEVHSGCAAGTSSGAFGAVLLVLVVSAGVLMRPSRGRSRRKAAGTR